MKKLIVFVCNGNIHRSVVAEKYLSQILEKERLQNKFSVASYGLQGTMGTPKPRHTNLIEYEKEWKAALPTLQRFKVDVTNHFYQKITPAVVKKAALIFAMDRKVYSGAKNSLLKQFPQAKNKIHRFSEITKNHKVIKDPAGSGSPITHKLAITNICQSIQDNLQVILSMISN